MGEQHARGSLPIGRRLVAYQLEHARAYRSRAQERARNCQAVLYLERDGKLYVVASFGGSDRPPDWYLNLVANPEVTVERRWARGAYRARTLAPEGATRDVAPAGCHVPRIRGLPEENRADH